MEEYIAKNVCLKPCTTYRENLAKHGKDVCVCGRQKSWHDTQKQQSTSKKQASTPNVPVFGTIQFRGFGKHSSQEVQYIKVNDYTGSEYIDVLWKLMVEYWHLSHPKLIITVSGGAKRFDLNSRLSNALKRGLVNSAAKTGAWLMTGGTKTGVRELVGEAVRDYYSSPNAVNAPVVCVGTVTWGIIQNKEVLLCKDGRGNFPALYESYGEESTNQPPRGKAFLDPNHTHFILVDKGDSMELSNNEFRTSLMSACKIEAVHSKEEPLPVPSVVVVINGGLGTITSVGQYVQELGTAVVVVSGSGRAADYIALASSKVTYNDLDEVFFPPDFDESLASAARSLFDWSRVSEAAQQQQLITESVKTCRVIVSCKRYLTVFHTDSEYNTELDTAILDALLKANKPSLKTQLHLALSWDQADVAKDKIFTVENKYAWKTKECFTSLQNAMFQALCKNQLEFVELLVDNGVEWDSFLTVNVLRDLYHEVVMKETYESSTGNLLKEILLTKIMHPGSYGCCGQSGVDVVQSNLLFYIGELISYLFNYHIDNFYKAKEYKVQKESSLHKNTKDPVPKNFKPMRELFLWAVLLNRKDLALIFWKHCDCNIVAAQLGNVLLNALADIAASHVETEQSAELKESAGYFENLAVGVLNESYSSDKSLTHRLLVRECSQWGSNTVFSMADSGEQMDIMAQSACQTKLSKIWMGRMVNDTPTYKIVISMFFPPMLLWIKFSEQPWKPEDLKMVKDAGELLGDTADNKVLPEAVEEFVSQKSSDQQTVYEVRCCGGCQDNYSICFLFAYYYYLQAPVVKFCYQNFVYILFLLLFIYFLTIEMRPFSEENWLSWVEFVIWITAIMQLAEEMRQISTEENLSVASKISSYFSSAWNMFDMLAHTALIISIILRFTVPLQNFLWVRITYGVTFIFYMMRFLQSFFVSQDMGPKVIMIRRMMKDLMFFMGLLFLFILCYGVVLQAVRFPNSTLSWPLVKSILFIPYFNIYGELFIENLQGDLDCTTNKTAVSLNSDLELCPETNEFVTILLAGYMLMSNILLVNLLIAMFSYTFELIQENSEKVWRFHRYSLIYEYYDRPVLAPPLIVINHLWRVLVFIYHKCKKLPTQNTEFRIHLTNDDSRRLSTFEKVAMERYLHTVYLEKKSSMTAKVNNSHERIEKVAEDLESVKDKIGHKMKMLSNSQSQAPVQSISTSHDGQAVNQMKSDINCLKSQMSQVVTMLEKMDTRLTELAPPSSSLYQLPEEGSVRRKSLHRETSVTTFTAPKDII